MRESAIAYIKVFVGWAMTIVPVWLNELNTLVGAISALIGLIGLIWTARNQMIKYRINKLELKKMENEADRKFQA